MPVRPRRARLAKHALTMRRYMDLMLGPPNETAAELRTLEAIFREHRHSLCGDRTTPRFDDDCWAARRWPEGKKPQPTGRIDVDQHDPDDLRRQAVEARLDAGEDLGADAGEHIIGLPPWSGTPMPAALADAIAEETARLRQE